VPEQAKKSMGVDVFIASVLDQLDLANTIVESIIKYHDIEQAKQKISDVEHILAKFWADCQNELKNYLGMTPTRIWSEALGQFEDKFPVTVTNWLDALSARVRSNPITAQVIDFYNKLYMKRHFLDTWEYILLEYPQSLLATKGEWYVNYNTQWNKLDLSTLWQVLMEEYADGKIKLEEAKKIWVEEARYLKGISAKDAEREFEARLYDMSPFDLFRISRNNPLDVSVIRKKLRRCGVRPEDEDYFINAIQREPIKDEASKAVGVLAEFAQYGQYSPTEIENFLRSWGYSTQEINFVKTYYDLLKKKLTQSLLRDAEIYLYRKGVITEDTLFKRLTTNLLIDKDVANALVRLEAAKKGIEWIAPTGG